MFLKVIGSTACIMGAAYLFIRNIFNGNKTPSAVIIGLLAVHLRGAPAEKAAPRPAASVHPAVPRARQNIRPRGSVPQRDL